ncbi:MAG: GGDEF domain-containing protein [Silvanigrellales bacterium]|jgi:two-component system cell cycle response regulator|nr:GGDEF domain-containing protein [Silvanigrellales bacterium]
MSDDKTVVAANPAESIHTTGRNNAAVLLQYDGGAAGKRFILTGTQALIGRRADKVQVWIDDASVSREHCRIDFHGNKAYVTDLGSLNHSYINDQMIIQSAELTHGDMLRVGNVRLRYYSHGSADQLLFDRIYRMAVQDRMLEIFRKDYLLEKLEEDFRLAKTNSLHLALLMFDLDKFKSINDTHGHDAGDFVLKEVCNYIKPLVRPEDTFARFGGEEFCLLLPKLTLDEAFLFGERVRQLIEKSVFDYEGTLIPVTLSIGVASCMDPALTSAIDFIKAADACVYKSKNAGRNRVSRP